MRGNLQPFPSSCRCACLRPRDPPSSPLRETSRSKAGSQRKLGQCKSTVATAPISAATKSSFKTTGGPGWAGVEPEDPSRGCRADSGQRCSLSSLQAPLPVMTSFLVPKQLVMK